MAPERFCPTHGPYDASYGSCPYCSGDYKRPPAPTPLNEDDMPTDIGYSSPPAGAYPGQGYLDDDAPTDLGQARQQGGRFLDADDEEETQLGRLHRDEDDDRTELYEVPTGLLGILWVRDGQRRGQIYKVKDGTTIGRKEGHILLDDPHVSKQHARLRLVNEQFELWDLASSTGTFVNGERIRAATALKENDRIKIGDTVFVLKVLEE